MQSLRHKKLTTTKGATKAGSARTESGTGGVQSSRVNFVRLGGNYSNSKREGADCGNSEIVGDDGVRTRRLRGDTDHERSNADGANCGNSRTVGADGIRTTRLRGDRDREKSNADGANCGTIGHDGDISERPNSDGVNSARVGLDVANSQPNSSSDGVNSQLNIASLKRVHEDPPKRGRKRMARTELRKAPRTGLVELEPRGHHQFKYVNYNPHCYKYPSQLGIILKREYPGIIKVYDDDGKVVKQQPALSWNDYYWKKNRFGVCCAKRVKQEFWSLFTVHPRHRARADKILENYLVKRVTNMMYQVRLEGVKAYFNERNEPCDDTRARTILLTEEEYLTCRVEWFNAAVWSWLAKYWNSEEFLQKRQKAQGSSASSEDPAPNRGGSRNFSETQQFLEYTFGLGKSGTLNTYAVMKSGMKKVDSTGRSGLIPSQSAQKRLDEYKALASDENSQDLDGKALYTMGRGMSHGRVPIGDGAIEKAAVLIHAKSKSVRPTDIDHYHSVVKENNQLKETNDILIEENSVHRELLMRMYADFGKEPPADLLRRLENIDVRRHQTTEPPLEDDGCSWYVSDDNDDNSWYASDDDLEGDDDDNLEGDDDNNLEGDDDDLEGDDEEDLEGQDGLLEDDDDRSNDLHGDHAGSKHTASVATDRSETRRTN